MAHIDNYRIATMNRYSKDYGLGFQSPTNRQRLTRAQAARVIATPLPKRTQGDRWSIVRPLAIGIVIAIAWALAFVVAFAS